MAIAITEFSGFCGFLPVQTIANYLSSVPEFSALIQLSVVNEFRAAVEQQEEQSIRSALKDVFSALMNASDEDVTEKVLSLTRRYREEEAIEIESGIRELVLELDRQYPGDVGIFCVFLLNVVKLEAGQAIFLKADEPHAYIHGGKWGPRLVAILSLTAPY